MALRKIVNIDEEKCDGCGECVPSCAEGAIQVIDGKARLVSDVYCDGLGNCLGECPQDAITIEEREAADFDEAAVKKRLKDTNSTAAASGGCPGASPQVIERCEIMDMDGEPGEKGRMPSRLANWPIQLQLIPPKAPYFEGADLLIAADCVPFSFADFHNRFMSEKTLIIGCPKLDNAEFYRNKLAQVFIQNDIRSVTVVYMEVPCCFGLVHLVHESLKQAGKPIPLKLYKVSIRGDIVETMDVEPGGDE